MILRTGVYLNYNKRRRAIKKLEFNMKKIIPLILILLFSACILNPDDNDSDKDQNQSEETIDYGPEQGSYDYYLAMSYTSNQSSGSDLKRFYILIDTAEDAEKINSIELTIEDQKIPLEFANYGGPDFYIAEFSLEYEDSYHYLLRINDKSYEADLEMIKELYTTFPDSVTENENVEIFWETIINPRMVQIVGCLVNDYGEFIQRNTEFLPGSSRSFSLPYEWLQQGSTNFKQVIMMTTMNYKIKDRICYTIADNSYQEF